MRFLRRRWRPVLGTIAAAAVVLAVTFPNGPEPDPDAFWWILSIVAWLGCFLSFTIPWKRHKAAKEHLGALRETQARMREHSEQAVRQINDANAKVAEVNRILAARPRPMAPNLTRPEKR